MQRKARIALDDLRRLDLPVGEVVGLEAQSVGGPANVDHRDRREPVAGGKARLREAEIGREQRAPRVLVAAMRGDLQLGERGRRRRLAGVLLHERGRFMGLGHQRCLLCRQHRRVARDGVRLLEVAEHEPQHPDGRDDRGRERAPLGQRERGVAFDERSGRVVTPDRERPQREPRDRREAAQQRSNGTPRRESGVVVHHSAPSVVRGARRGESGRPVDIDSTCLAPDTLFATSSCACCARRGRPLRQPARRALRPWRCSGVSGRGASLVDPQR